MYRQVAEKSENVFGKQELLDLAAVCEEVANSADWARPAGVARSTFVVPLRRLLRRRRKRRQFVDVARIVLNDDGRLEIRRIFLICSSDMRSNWASLSLGRWFRSSPCGLLSNPAQCNSVRMPPLYRKPWVPLLFRQCPTIWPVILMPLAKVVAPMDDGSSRT
jgi:hypothetical protein